jgi:membrane protease YdiL (CAAX protease family)
MAMTYRPSRPVLRNEILLVLGVSLGASGVFSLVDLIAKLTAPAPLSQQTTALNTSAAPGRPYLDLTLQLLSIFFSIVPALLALHLLRRDHPDALNELGLNARRPWFDLGWGGTLAAVVGIPGLALYIGAKALGLNTVLSTANLPHIWWAVPVYLLNAAQNAVLEEVVVVGYLLTRLRDIGWPTLRAIAASALLRGSYHLYQGFGGFVGNAIMGVLFGLFFLRTRRVVPLIVAHTILDIVAYLGYIWLHNWSLLR